MKPIERGEILGLADYEMIRERFRARIIAEKKLRRFSMGPRASGVFENRDTVLLQIQEMIRTERITREGAILHEIETYNELVPGEGQLSATVLIEIDDKAEREDFLTRAKGLEKATRVDVNGRRFAASWNPAREQPDRASAVMYLRFALDPEAVESIRGRRAKVAIEVDHPAYQARGELGPETLASLAEDFNG